MEAALNGPLGRTILEPPVFTIGSASDNRLVINNYNVSSHHAEIRQEERGYCITDLGSAYGTFVNEQRLDWNASYLLNPGDTILIGGTKFIYEIRDTSQAGSAPFENSGLMSSPGLPPSVAATPPAYTAYGSDLPHAYQPLAYPDYVAPQQPTYVSQSWSATGVPPGYAPPAVPGEPLAAQVQHPKTKRRTLWITLGSIGVVLLAGILVFIYVIRSTPDKTLDTFCNSMQSGDYQTAYGQFSSALQRMQSEPQFASENKLTSCIHGPTNQSDGIATASLTTTSVSGTKSSGMVTLVQDSTNNWKINTLPSTPSITLDAFCNALKARDYQAAYNQLSSRVQGQTSELDFANNLSQSQIDSCVYNTPGESGNTATGSMTFLSSGGQSVVSIVTLVKEDNVWKIDGLS